MKHLFNYKPVVIRHARYTHYRSALNLSEIVLQTCFHLHNPKFNLWIFLFFPPLTKIKIKKKKKKTRTLENSSNGAKDEWWTKKAGKSSQNSHKRDPCQWIKLKESAFCARGKTPAFTALKCNVLPLSLAHTLSLAISHPFSLILSPLSPLFRRTTALAQS